MGNSVPHERLGPINLAPGVTQTHAVTKLYAAFISIAMFTGMSFLQGYIFTEHLNIPRGQHGMVAGVMSFWTELVMIALTIPFGILSDRIGRRPVYVFGTLFVGLGYGLYPFATSINELLAYRLIYAVGLSAVAAMIASLSNDYPQNNSRGKFIAISAMMNTLGTIFMARGIAHIPDILTTRGFDPVAAGKVMFLVCAGLCVLSALIGQIGLRGGLPEGQADRPDAMTLLRKGYESCKNPRIALSYAGAFAARSDLVIKGLFLSLWAIQDGRTYGLSPAEAMAKYGSILAIMQIISFSLAPLYGWLIDRIYRVTAMIIALVFAAFGYASMYIITTPLDFAMLPYFIVLSLGSSFMLKSSLALVGQEAPARERGTIVAVNGWFGAIGILIYSLIGGYYFDVWGPWAPFVLVAAYQFVLLFFAILVRLRAPGASPETFGRPDPLTRPAQDGKDPTGRPQTTAPSTSPSNTLNVKHDPKHSGD